MDSAAQEALRTDIRLLGDTLGRTIRRLAGQPAFDLEEDVRAAAKALRASHSVERARDLRDRLDALDLPALRGLIRAFTVYFDLINLAEQQARVRALRQRTLELAPRPVADSPEAALLELRQRGVSANDVAEHLAQADVCLVFTAHPSEARRRTVLERLSAIAAQLDRLELSRLLPDERARAQDAIAAEVETFWLTDIVRAGRPTVLQEVKSGTELVESSLLEVVPRVYRDLEAALRRVWPDHDWHLPPLLRFGSWIGGDRDGNPNVTPAVTAEAVKAQQESVLGHYEGLVDALARRLSHSDQFVRPSDGFLAAIRHDAELFPEWTGTAGREPFRDRCRLIAARLRRTRDYLRTLTPRWHGPDPTDVAGLYLSRGPLLGDLRQLRDELHRCGATAAADGPVADLIRLVEVFGVHLLTLDLRQHSARHASAVAEVLRHAGVCPDYQALDPDGRFEVLARELESRRPLVPAHLPFSPETNETVETFRTVAALLEQQCPEAVDTYIISNTTEPAHLLEVLLLAREARLFRPDDGISRLQIVPLFEALIPLRTGAAILERLYAVPAYRRHLALRGDAQEVMIGYSDSNKESGSLQSAWALYRAQCELVASGRQHGVTVRFFHGRGGSVGRGGGPANRAILAQPRDTVNDRLRITEQGEMIADRYGHPAIAERHLGQIVNAVVRSSFPDQGELPDPSWEGVLDVLADSACRHYRELVYDTPEFLTYFEQATPIREISQLKIGSRPARRTSAGGIDQLRAIPWVFAWMQSRHTLPGWYGLGSALAEYREADPGSLAVLRQMYRRWPFWRSFLDNVQMVLAKADMTIARLYADLVEDATLGDRIFGRIGAEYQRTADLVCAVTEQSTLLERVPVLRHSIQQRNPYVDPLSFVQLVLLRRLRSEERPSEELLTGVLESINGVSAGLKNTG